MKHTLLLMLLLAMGQVGCAEELDPPSLIERVRVLGARVEVEGRPDEATPRPGEQVKVTWVMAAPGDVPPVGWAFTLCQGQSLACTGEPLAIVQGQGAPEFVLKIPEQVEGSELTLYGQICTASDPLIDAATGQPGCSMGGDGTTASVAIRLQGGAAGNLNLNPSLNGLMWFDDVVWNASAETCDGLPKVAAGTKKHRVRIATVGSDRQVFEALTGDPPALKTLREHLQISQFTTAGKFNRSFSFVESDEGDAPITEFTWDAPELKEVPEAGMVVRFTFVVRDLRGGLGSSGRSACVTR